MQNGRSDQILISTLCLLKAALETLSLMPLDQTCSTGGLRLTGRSLGDPGRSQDPY